MNKFLILCAVIASVFSMSAQAMQSVDEFGAKQEASDIALYGHVVYPPTNTDSNLDNYRNKHLEYDIIHKDGTTEHCYQIMEGHSIQCH